LAEALFEGTFLLTGAFLLVGAFLAAAALTLVGALVPVTAFLAVPRFEGVVVFFAGAGFLPARIFFGALAAAAFETLVVSDFFSAFLGATVLTPAVAVFDFVTDFLETADLAATAFVEAALAGRALVTGLGATAFAGLFSFDAEVSAGLAFLGGSLTFPAGPLGKTKIPFSAPVAMARAN